MFARCFTRPVPLDFLFRAFSREAAPATLAVAGREVPLRLVRNARARRYLLRVTADGAARVTVPRGGSVRAAVEFARRQENWLAAQFTKRSAQQKIDPTWKVGAEFFFRGEPAALTLVTDNNATFIRFADQSLHVPADATTFRPLIEAHLRQLAERELPARVTELERQFSTLDAPALPLRRVTVRDQRSRWGSCSVRGTISLNWRLVQVPPFVRDYILLHELAHLRVMNHSARYWHCVETVCPAWRDAERWLKQHAKLLR